MDDTQKALIPWFLKGNLKQHLHLIPESEFPIANILLCTKAKPKMGFEKIPLHFLVLVLALIIESKTYIVKENPDRAKLQDTSKKTRRQPSI